MGTGNRNRRGVYRGDLVRGGGGGEMRGGGGAATVPVHV